MKRDREGEEAKRILGDRKRKNESWEGTGPLEKKKNHGPILRGLRGGEELTCNWDWEGGLKCHKRIQGASEKRRDHAGVLAARGGRHPCTWLRERWLGGGGNREGKEGGRR